MNIEYNINEIKRINDNINKFNYNDSKIKYNTEEKEVDKLFKIIKKYGFLYFSSKFKFNECPNNIEDHRKYIVSGDNGNKVIKLNEFISIHPLFRKNNWIGIMFNNILEKDREYRWKVKILKTQDFNIMIGVSPNNCDIKDFKYKDCGWYLFCYNSKFYSGPPHNYNEESSNLPKIKNEVKLIMDMKKKH